MQAQSNITRHRFISTGTYHSQSFVLFSSIWEIKNENNKKTLASAMWKLAFQGRELKDWCLKVLFGGIWPMGVIFEETLGWQDKTTRKGAMKILHLKLHFPGEDKAHITLMLAVLATKRNLSQQTHQWANVVSHAKLTLAAPTKKLQELLGSLVVTVSPKDPNTAKLRQNKGPANYRRPHLILSSPCRYKVTVESTKDVNDLPISVTLHCNYHGSLLEPLEEVKDYKKVWDLDSDRRVTIKGVRVRARSKGKRALLTKKNTEEDQPPVKKSKRISKRKQKHDINNQSFHLSEAKQRHKNGTEQLADVVKPREQARLSKLANMPKRASASLGSSRRLRRAISRQRTVTPLPDDEASATEEQASDMEEEASSNDGPGKEKPISLSQINVSQMSSKSRVDDVTGSPAKESSIPSDCSVLTSPIGTIKRVDSLTRTSSIVTRAMSRTSSIVGAGILSESLNGTDALNRTWSGGLGTSDRPSYWFASSSFSALLPSSS
eukprot:g19180.t1